MRPLTCESGPRRLQFGGFGRLRDAEELVALPPKVVHEGGEQRGPRSQLGGGGGGLV